MHVGLRVFWGLWVGAGQHTGVERAGACGEGRGVSVVCEHPCAGPSTSPVCWGWCLRGAPSPRLSLGSSE